MSPHAYTEDQLIEQPAIGLFAELGWTTVSALEEQIGGLGAGEGSLLTSAPTAGLGRETKGEVVLGARLRVALERLNPGLPPEAITNAVDELTRDRSAMSLPAANREIYALIKDGIRVSIPEPDEAPPLPSSAKGQGDLGLESSQRKLGGQRTERVRVIDWENPAANDFLLVSQFSVTGTLYTCRPDLIGFVNGLPLVVIELKKPGASVRTAFEENLSHYKLQIPALFWFNALLIASNGTDSRVGSLTADWERFFEWKRIEREDEPRRVSLETILRGTCDRTRLLDLVENFTLFSEHEAGLVKIIGQNHQVLGVNAAIRSLLRIRPLQTNPNTLTPAPLPEVEVGEHYRGGLQFAGLVERARELRQRQTSAEDVAWELLRDRRFEQLKFRRQHQIGNYIADFCCAEHKLDVEVDGDVHRSLEVAAKDSQRDAYLRSMGYTVLRFPNQLVLDQPEEFLRQIAAAAKLPSTSGRGAGGEGKTSNPNGIGVFWQTQGSGKSFSMVFFAQKVLRKLPGNWTFVVITDRVELDVQIAGTFKATGAVSQADGDYCHATSGAHLRELLKGNHRYVFTLIHKFQPEKIRAETPSSPTLLPGVDGSGSRSPSTSGRGARGEGHDDVMPVLCDRDDVIVLTDEAHRSQYDTLALNMRAALPKALFLAFTGTPLIAGEERTKDLFGDYVSVYDFQQSIEDGATVPLFYENRTPELQLVNPDLNEEIYDLIEAADLNPDQEAKLDRELSRQYHILTRDDRLETVAKDIVRHFLGRGFLGKAMVVSIDKATALRMHDKVRKHWAEERARVERRMAELTGYPAHKPKRKSERASADAGAPYEGEDMQELHRRLQVLISTDMALIVSPGQNEIQQMQRLGLDIETHRRRMNESMPTLDSKFKKPDDPLRIVFLCAMWLTGFDVPSCSTVYLDKPIRNHTLMQTIARANRVFPGKHSGMIVDYANVFTSLEKALAIYGSGRGGQTPVRDKKLLVAELRAAVEAATQFCAARQVFLQNIEAAPIGSLERLQQVSDAVNALISPDTVRREFLGHERVVATLYAAVKPDPAALEFSICLATLATIAGAIQTKLNPEPADISAIMGQVSVLLDASITGVAMPATPAPVIDLSRIDFEALRKRFEDSSQKNSDLEVLKAVIQAQLDKLIRLNRTRTDFREKFEELIESYNAGSRNIEELFAELVTLTRGLSEEQSRHLRENLTEEELVVFDILTRPAPELSPEEQAEVKKVARQLLARLKDILVINWRNKSTARSQLRIVIEDVLDTGLPRVYTPEIFQAKCSALFEHVYESYPERDAGVYAT